MNPLKWRLPRTAVLAVLALVSGALATLFIAAHVRDRIQRIEAQAQVPMAGRIVAARDLPAGTQLVPDDLALRQFPAQWVASDTLPAERFAELDGRTLRVALRAGDPVVAAHTQHAEATFATQIAPGRRAITLPVDQVNSLSGLLRPGDLIDLYVSFEYQRKHLTTPLLQGVLVLATGRETRVTDLDGAPSSYSTLTLDAAPEDVVKLVAARQAGQLTAILRHPEDGRADRRAARGDLASLLGLGHPAPEPRRRAVVLYGSSTARALPTWATPAGVQRRPGNGWFDMPEGQALVSAWMQGLAEAAGDAAAGLLPAELQAEEPDP